MIASPNTLPKSLCISRVMLTLFIIVSVGSLLPLATLLLYCMFTQTFNPLQNLVWLSLFSGLLGVVGSFILLKALLKPLLLTLSALDVYLKKEANLNNENIPAADCLKQFADNLQYLLNKVSTLNDNFQRHANNDPLTGLINHPAAEELLHKEVARAQRDNLHILLVMIDIGNFQRVNEQFGKQIGDVCLTHIAEVLTGSVREGDWVARWSEDQFLIVLWNFNYQYPLEVLTRIQSKSQQTPVGELLQLDISMGACEFLGNMRVEDLIAYTDAALREAKQAGSSNIQIATPYNT